MLSGVYLLTWNIRVYTCTWELEIIGKHSEPYRVGGMLNSTMCFVTTFPCACGMCTCNPLPSHLITHITLSCPSSPLPPLPSLSYRSIDCVLRSCMLQVSAVYMWYVCDDIVHVHANFSLYSSYPWGGHCPQPELVYKYEPSWICP